MQVKFKEQIFSLTLDGTNGLLFAKVNDTMELWWYQGNINTHRATLFFMANAERQVPYEEKLARITFFESSVVILERMMVQCHKIISKQNLEQLLGDEKLPRIKMLEAYTETRGLKKLFKNFGTENGNQYEMDWQKLADAAQKGEIVKMWIAQKQAEKDSLINIKITPRA